MEVEGVEDSAVGELFSGGKKFSKKVSMIINLGVNPKLIFDKNFFIALQ